MHGSPFPRRRAAHRFDRGCCLTLTFGCWLWFGCAPSLDLEPPPLSAISGLEANVRADSTDTDAGVRLAAAYRGADRPSEAVTLLERLHALNPGDPAVPVWLGLAYEDVGEFGQARQTYQDFLDSVGGPLEDAVRERLDALALQELRESVQAAVSRESEIAPAPPTPNTVGVFPFRVVSSDPELQPLERAMAEMLVTDLAITGRLQVLERVRVQVLLDELALAQAGWTEPSTGARAGRLLSTERIVQGRIDVTETDIRMDAAVVETTGTGASDPVTSTGVLARFFEMEKEIALGLYAEMGVLLTPAQRSRVSEQATDNIQALLAFGRGLAASDGGDFETAADEFGEAARIDPGFTLAQTQLRRASRSASARGRSRAAMAGRAARLSRMRRAVAAIRNNPAGLRPGALKNLTDKQRAILSEVLGQDRLADLLLLEIVFRPPGG